MGSAQRCQLHRRLISLSLAGVGPGGGNGAGGNGGGAGRMGVGSVDSWDWEDAWERMPPNLRVSLFKAGCEVRAPPSVVRCRLTAYVDVKKKGAYSRTAASYRGGFLRSRVGLFPACSRREPSCVSRLPMQRRSLERTVGL